MMSFALGGLNRGFFIKLNAVPHYFVESAPLFQRKKGVSYFQKTVDPCFTQSKPIMLGEFFVQLFELGFVISYFEKEFLGKDDYSLRMAFSRSKEQNVREGNPFQWGRVRMLLESRAFKVHLYDNGSDYPWNIVCFHPLHLYDDRGRLIMVKQKGSKELVSTMSMRGVLRLSLQSADAYQLTVASQQSV